MSITNAELEASVSLVARSALALESQLQRDVAQAQLAASQLIRDDNEQEMNRFKLEFQVIQQKIWMYTVYRIYVGFDNWYTMKYSNCFIIFFSQN